MFAIPASRLLLGSIIAAFIGLGTYIMQVDSPEASMAISPQSATRSEGEEFVVDVVVESDTPVNAFAGTITFDAALLEVARIDYNNSIADLWAEAPWYENGDGTVSFAGGSTQPGGFTGSGSIITITFKTKGAGVGAVEIARAQILKHDGLGTDATIATPIDALFTVTADVGQVAKIENATTQVVVANKGVTLDLSGDGKQSLADVSILLEYLITGNLRGDLNQDGKVSIADVSVLLDTL